jgi:hypothetical protein
MNLPSSFCVNSDHLEGRNYKSCNTLFEKDIGQVIECVWTAPEFSVDGHRI